MSSEFGEIVRVEPMPAAGAPPYRRSLQLTVAISVGLFYIYMLMPARLQESISLITLDEPADAIAYGIGYPYFTALDAIMLAWGVASWMTIGIRRHARSTGMFAYVAVSLVSAAIAYRQSLIANEVFHWDGVLGAVRLLAVYLLFAGAPGDEARWGRRLQDVLALLFLSSLVLNLAGFQNRTTYSNEAGRLTASGLDFATTSYFGGVLVLLAVTESVGRRRQVLIGAGLVGLAMGGSRNAIVIGVIALVVLALQGRARIPKVLVKLAAGASVLAVLVAVVFPQLLERIPTLSRGKDDAMYYVEQPDLTPHALRYFPFLRDVSLSQPALVGRLNTWASGLTLLEENQWRPLGSDWRVQEGLALLSVPSHSHNAYLQTALKFGPLAVLVWVPLFISAWRGLWRHSPYGTVLFFLLASCVLDYWMLVAKALFLFYALAGLNDRWLARRDRRGVAPRGARPLMS